MLKSSKTLYFAVLSLNVRDIITLQFEKMTLQLKQTRKLSDKILASGKLSLGLRQCNN